MTKKHDEGGPGLSPVADIFSRILFWGGIVVLADIVVGPVLLTNPGYDPAQIEACKPHYTSDRKTSAEEATALANRYKTVGGDFKDTAAHDLVIFQEDKINGIGEIVCRVLVGDQPEYKYTIAGKAIAEDPAFGG